MVLNFITKKFSLGDNTKTPEFQFYDNGFVLGKPVTPQPTYQDVTVSGLDVLNLPNAKADGLNYCKLYGKCEQRNLPEGYTQVEYLQSSGTQWIDTGYKPNANIKFEISGTQSNSDSALFGLSELFFCFDNGNATYYNFFGGSVGSFSATLKNVPIVLTMSASDGIVINGTKYKSLTAGSATANYPMALFGRRNNSTGAIDKLGSHIIKYAKIYESNILIHHYIPCRRNSDSVLGMYDTVTNTFLTNAGTGTFTAGNDVVPTPTRPLNIICNNGVVKVSPNLFDINNPTYCTGYISTNSNGIIESSTLTDTFYIKCQPNTTYTLQRDKIKVQNQVFRLATFSTIPQEGVSCNKITGGLTDNLTISITTGNDDVYVGFSIGRVKAGETTYLSGVQLEKSSTATAYMPYKQVYTDGTVETVQDSLNNTATVENLLAVENYKDVQSILDGGITRNVGVKVLDGTEVISYEGQYTRFNIAIPDMVGGVRNVPMFCTHYNVVADGRELAAVPNNSIYGIRVPSRVSVKTDEYTTVASFTSFLQQQYANGTPVIIIYPLQTPTTSTVTAQTLTTKEGTNTIEIMQASLTGLPIEVNYKAGVTVTVTEIQNANLDNQVTVTIGD